MNNKIILELNDGSSVEKDNCNFILLNGENNTVRMKVDDVVSFEKIKGLLIAVFGNNNRGSFFTACSGNFTVIVS